MKTLPGLLHSLGAANAPAGDTTFSSVWFSRYSTAGRWLLCFPVGLIPPGRRSDTRCIFIPDTNWKRRIDSSRALCITVWSIPNKIPPRTSVSFPLKIFFNKPVSHRLSLKQAPGQLLLQATTLLSPSLPWTLVPFHPFHLIAIIPTKRLCPLSQFPPGSALAVPSPFLPA